MSKIVKTNGTPDEFELSVAQEFANLEVSTALLMQPLNYWFNIWIRIQANANEIKADLHDLYISASKEIEID